MNLTREILRRNAAFEIICFHNLQADTAATSLPSWCPDWLAEGLSETAWQIAQRSPRLAPSYAASACREDGPKLFVQGIEFGMVVAMTSVLGGSDSPTSAVDDRSITTPKSRYYGRALREALAVCLHASTVAPQRRDTFSVFDLFVPRSLYWYVTLAASKGILSRCRPIWPSFDLWLEENKNFDLGGRSLHKISSHNMGTPGLLFARFLVGVVTLTPFCGCLVLLLYVASVLTATGLALNAKWGATAVALSGGLYMGEILLFGTPLALAGRTAYKMRRDLLHAGAVNSKIFSTARLVVLNTGAIAITCTDARPGDKICLIAGCTSSMVIRRTSPDGEELYSTVGRAFVCMSREHSVRYRAFCERHLGHRAEPGRRHYRRRRDLSPDFHATDETEYTRLINKYKNYEEWRTFTLI